MLLLLKVLVDFVGSKTSANVSQLLDIPKSWENMQFSHSMPHHASYCTNFPKSPKSLETPNALGRFGYYVKKSLI